MCQGRCKDIGVETEACLRSNICVRHIRCACPVLASPLSGLRVVGLLACFCIGNNTDKQKLHAWENEW